VTSAEICAAIFEAPLPDGVTRLAASASPGFTRPEQGEARDPPPLAGEQAGATVTELLVRSDSAGDGTRKHRLVTATRNVVLDRSASGWAVAASQPAFEGEFLSAERPAAVAPNEVFDDEKLLARYRPRRGTPCAIDSAAR
jgi:hypothetical protein